VLDVQNGDNERTGRLGVVSLASACTGEGEWRYQRGDYVSSEYPDCERNFLPVSI